MRSVFASDFLEFFKELDFIKLVISIGVSNAVETSALVFFVIHDDVERIEGIAHSPSMTDVEIDLFDLIFLDGFSCRRAGESIEGSVLVTRNEASFVILAKGYPRAKVLFWDGINAFDFEAIFHIESLRMGCFGDEVFGADKSREGESRSDKN